MNKVKPIERIDMHSHYFPDAYYQLLQKYGITNPDNVYVPKWSLSKHLSDMEAANIIYTCLSITSPFFSFVDSDELPEAVRRRLLFNNDRAVVLRGWRSTRYRREHETHVFRSCRITGASSTACAVGYCRSRATRVRY